MVIGSDILIITLNVMDENAPVKRYRLTGWIQKKQDPYIHCLQETHFISTDTYRLKVREWEVFYANGNHKKAGAY